MAPKNMCKKDRVIDTNQIQSKTQKQKKILNHRDLGKILVFGTSSHDDDEIYV